MFLALSLLLIAWFVEMPLWLSIVTTVFAGVTIVIKMLYGLFGILTDDAEKQDKYKED